MPKPSSPWETTPQDETVSIKKAESRELWLKARQTGIGGSDAAVVLGMNPWKSAYALWAEKTGKIEPDDLSKNEAVEWGSILEPVVALKYADVTGRNVRVPYLDEDGIMRHPDHAFMIGTPDRFFYTPDDTPGVLEIKTTGAHRAADWAEEPPVHYQIQGQQYAAITGVSLISFAVLIGGQKFHWCDTQRNDRFISHLIEQEEMFWDCVKRDTPPATDNSKSTAEALSRLYAAPDESAQPVMLDFEYAELATRRRKIKAAAAKLEKMVTGIDNRIKAALGDAVYGYLADGSGFSWKKQHRDSYVVEASDYRVLREIKPKKG